MTQLLFFDTFSHDMEEELNLDLVQFPSSVIVEEVRVIPLGARVQANFPGGMRLGATVPVRFNLELFVNDLTNPGASTFTSLGTLAYDENGKIFLNTGPKKILTDGLILRGCYSTITLAVYGLLAPTTTEQLAAMAAATASVKPEPIMEAAPPQPPPPARGPGEWNHRVQTATAWPPPVPDNVRGNVAQESYHRGEWIAAENGQRPIEPYYDHHHSKRRSLERRSRSPLRVSYPPREFRSPRDFRSPKGDFRSRTRSRSRSPPPPLPPMNRRSLTPKSPTSNGHLSPHNYKRRSTSLEKPVAQIKEEPPILDDVSDISDGDIPADEDDPMNDDKPEEELAYGLEHHEDHQDQDDSYEKQSHLLADIPEDIEEISDDEAEWSDDGDCFFGDNLAEYEVDFGPDWTDPIRPFSPKSHKLVALKYYRLFPPPTSSSRISERFEQSKEMLDKLEELNEHQVLGSDWVETVESFTTKILPTRKLLRTILRGLSTSDALNHQVHTFKVRHLKSSLKLTIAAMSHAIEWKAGDFSEIFAKLERILSDSTIAIPLKVLALIALNRTLDHSLAMATFIKDELLTRFAEMLVAQNLTTRLKVGLTSLLERFSLKEAVEALKSGAYGHQEKMALLSHILSAVRNNSKPKLTFLSNEKCGVVPSVLRDLFNANVLENVLVACQKAEEKLQQEMFDSVQNILKELTRTKEGLLLLASFPSETETLLSLISSRVDSDFELFCIHALLRVDALSYFGVSHESPRDSLERMEILTTIQELYGMTFSIVGRTALVHVLSLWQFLRPVIRLVKHSSDDACAKQANSEEEQVRKKDMKKSAIRGYACELLLLVVRTADEVEYLKFFADELLAIGKSDETSKLHELVSWLTFLEGQSENIWTSATMIQPSAMVFFCEIVKKNLDSISPLSCELVVAIRFLFKLLREKSCDSSAMTIIRAFSNDLSEHSVAILTKVCGYHEQPHLHTATFAGYNGHLLVATIRPIVQILKFIVSDILRCLDDGFRDTTAIQTLLKTFALCTVVSKNSACYNGSLEICNHIIEFLMCFTGVSVDMSLSKITTWQLMVQDVLKYLLTSPHTYLPGLKILSEILPLPLRSTTTTDVQRNLWSAQLYGMESLLREMIILLTPCKVKPVRKLLRQVCMQLADLSAPIAVIVAEAVAEALKSEAEMSSGFACVLLKCPSIKAAFLSLLREKCSGLLKSLPPSVVSAMAHPLTDLKVSLTPEASSSDLQNISNSLPDKESCLLLVTTLISCSISKPYANFARTVNGLSKNVCGLSVIRSCFLQNKSEVAKILKDMDAGGLTLVGESLMAMSKHVGIDELREILDWTGDSGETEHYLYNDDLGQSLVVKKLVAHLQREPTNRPEEFDFEWPLAESLLEQFGKRKASVYSGCNEALEEDRGEPEKSPAYEDLLGLIESYLPEDFDIQLQVKQVCDEKSLEREKQQKKKVAKKSLLEAKVLANKSLISNFKAGGNVAIRGSRSVFNRGPGGQRPDLFRSRPPNTSRPPSLHVDDFLVLQSRGQQPTGPTGYNKQSLKAAQELFAEKEAKSKGSIVGYREATKEPVFEKSGASATLPGSNSGSGPKGRGSERATSGSVKGYRGSGNSGNGRTSFNNRDRHGASSNVSNSGGRGWSPSAASGRDYGREGRSAGRPPPNDRRFSNSRRNGGDPRRGGKDRNKGKARIAEGSRNVR